MAKQIGPIKRIGLIDGKIHYKMNGEYYVKNSSAPTKKKIKKDTAFAAFRNNSKEFGAASSIGSLFRKSFGSVLDSVSDKKLYYRIAKLFANIIHTGQGEQGRRSIKILANKVLFQDLQFKEDVVFDYVFKVPFTIEASLDRKVITVNVPAFRASSGIKKITGVTHFKLILTVLAFSNYSYDNKAKGYLSDSPDLNKLLVTEFSALVPIREEMVDPICLISKLNISSSLPETLGLVACVGIEFYQKVAGKFYPVETWSCMKIADVF